MKHYISLNNQGNFKSVCDTIKKYYPIGLKPSKPEYTEHIGFKELGDIIVANVHDEKKFTRLFGDLEEAIINKLRKDVIGTTYGVGPSISGDVILERYEDKSMWRVKKLSFAISLIGPFFTIYGVDETSIKIPEYPEASGNHAINIVTISPFYEFEIAFHEMRKIIEAEFDSYKFVPFTLLSKHIAGLHLSYKIDENEDCTIFEALFNHLLNDYDMNKVRGDRTYGFDIWNTDETVKS